MGDVFSDLSTLIGEGSAHQAISSMTENDMPAFEDIVTPDIKPKKAESDKPLIVVIDDDFSTLDIMKIYLARGFTCETFSSPKDAIFYLNNHVPDLIFMDCYLNMVKTKMMLEIIGSYTEFETVPIVYICEDDEYGAVKSKLPERVSDLITRPVKRGDLQNILDEVFPKELM